MVCLALAGSGIGLGLSTLFEDQPTRDQQIVNYERTISAAERRIDRSRTRIAQLTQTPEPPAAK